MPEPHIAKELQRLVFRLTLALYRVTDFFPAEEPLRCQLRKTANEIFETIIGHTTEPNQNKTASMVIGKTAVMQSFLGIAETLRFVRGVNIAILRREYRTLEAFFLRELEAKPAKKTPGVVELKKQNFYPHTGREESTPHGTVSDATSGIASFKGGQGNELNERQLTILEILSERKSAKISDFFTFFQGVSSKTIQRDLQDLAMRGILKKEGERRWTMYTLVREL